MMNIRDQLQEEWAEAYQNHGGPGILHLCPRAGKIRTSIRIFCKIQRNIRRTPSILICYPDKNIQKSWEDEFIAVGYKNPNITYVTHISMHKEVGNKYDIVVCDEIHLLSAKQKMAMRQIMAISHDIIGLSGTLSKDTQTELKQELRLPVIINYTIDEAINDGLISDYRINVVKVELDDVQKIYKKNTRTEKAQYRAYSYVIEHKGGNLMLNLNRMRVIHNSLSKTAATMRILDKLKNERTLVFCANNKVAKTIGCKIHTAKFNNQEDFDKFIAGKGKNHMAVCKIGNTGLSFRSLAFIVVQAFDSNSENLTQRICRSLILDAKGKISTIYIVSSTEKAELKWLDKSLEFFDKNKIKYL